MDRQRKVLWLIKGLGRGGAESLLALSLPHLDRGAFQYEAAYLLPWKKDLLPDFERAGVPVHCLESRRRLDLGLVLRLARLLKRRQVDVLHVHSPYAALFGRVAARLARVPAVVYTEHNVLTSYHPATRILHRLTSRLDTCTIAVSQEVQRSVLDSAQGRRKPVQVIYGGVEVAAIEKKAEQGEEYRARLGIPGDHLVVGNVAHLRPQKGHGYLLEAARQVLLERPATTFIVIGREKVPGYQKSLEARARELGLGDRVRFLGFQPDPLPIVACFDVFALSSVYEGLPLALLEAMAMGKPSVVTAVGGVPEVVQDGVNGLLVPPRDPSALAHKLLRLLGHPDLRQKLAVSARRTVEQRFTIARMVREVEALYRRLLAGEEVVLGPLPATERGG